MPTSTQASEVVEAATIAVSNKVTLLGGGTGVVFGFLHQNMVAICGIALGLLGYFTNLYFQHRRDQREIAEREEQRAEHLRRLDKLATKPGELS